MTISTWQASLKACPVFAALEPMAKDETSAITQSLNDLGMGATITTAIAALWASGWWHWIPTVLVACLGTYTLLLERQLPWHGTLYKDLQQLDKGEGSHPVLQRAFRRALDGMLWNRLDQAVDRPSQDVLAGAGRWLKTMSYANQRLDRWMGNTIWSYSVFDRLLLVAVLYPVLLLLIVWWWTGISRLGSTEVLPALGSGAVGFGWRSLVTGLALWPGAFWLLWRRWPGAVRDIDSLKMAVLISTLLLAPVFVALFFPLFWGLKDVSNAVVVVFASAGTLVFAVGLAGGSVLGGAGAFAIAAGFAIAFGDAFAGESVVAGSIGFLVACAVEFAIAVISVILIVKMGKQTSEFRLGLAKASAGTSLVSIMVLILGAILLLGTTALRWLPLVGMETENPVPRNAMWLFALGWMPVINAVFDWFSLGITRELLRRVTRSPGWMWGGVLLDVLVGVVLTLGLLLLAFQVLRFMQWCGWPVSAETMRAAFIANPFDPQVTWLAMLSVTNLLPTIWHLGATLWGLVDRQFTTSVSLRDSLERLVNFMDQEGNPKPDAQAPNRGELELQTVYQSLYVHPWLYVGTVIAVVVGFWGSFVQALRWTLTWLP